MSTKKIKCKSCKIVKEHTKENFPRDSAISGLSHTCRDCKKINNYKYEFGIVFKYEKRKCLKCDKLFKSKSKSNRICSNCKVTL